MVVAKHVWTETEMQLALFSWLEFRGRTMILPNFTPRSWQECDMFSITTALYFHEIEVKVSRADFRADFRKEEKHLVLAGKAAKEILTSIGWKPRELCPPRTFHYACPEGLLSESDVPEYAGLIWVSREERQCDGYVRYRVKIVKKAPSVRCAEKLSGAAVFKIANNLWFRFASTWKELAREKLSKRMEARDEKARSISEIRS